MFGSTFIRFAAILALTIPAASGIVVADNDPVGTTFTYQGRLTEAGEPVSGTVDLVFNLFDQADGGTPLGVLVADDFPVGDDGRFTIDLDFGALFNGGPRWLEIEVNQVALSPRQPIMAAPHAMVATTAANVPTKAVIGSYAGITGVGTLDSLDVAGNFFATSSSIPIRAIRDASSGSFPGIWGETNSASSGTSGVRGYANHTNPGSSVAGVWGRNLGTTNNGYGVRGTHDGGGSGVYGTSATGIGVEGVGTPGVLGRAASQDTYGGFFAGSGDWGGGNSLLSIGETHLLDRVGVGTTSPNSKLHVDSLAGENPLRVQRSGATKLLVHDNGNVTIGSASTPQDTLHVVGTTRTNVIRIMGGSDLAERFDISEIEDITPQPGMVLCIDPRNPGKLIPSTSAYDRTVAGVISGANGINSGMIMGQEGSEADGQYPVALTGRVYVWADATAGTIEPGDMLTTSGRPGHAMKVEDYSRAQGAIIGKAMTSLAEGEVGYVLVLVNLQ